MEKYSYCWWENKKIITLWLWKWEASYSITCSNKFKWGSRAYFNSKTDKAQHYFSKYFKSLVSFYQFLKLVSKFNILQKKSDCIVYIIYKQLCIGDRNGPVIVMLTFLMRSCKPLIPNNRKTNHNFSDLNLRPSGMCQCWSQMIFKVSLDFKMFFVKWIL